MINTEFRDLETRITDGGIASGDLFVLLLELNRDQHLRREVVAYPWEYDPHGSILYFSETFPFSQRRYSLETTSGTLRDHLMDLTGEESRGLIPIYSLLGYAHANLTGGNYREFPITNLRGALNSGTIVNGDLLITSVVSRKDGPQIQIPTFVIGWSPDTNMLELSERCGTTFANGALVLSTEGAKRYSLDLDPRVASDSGLLTDYEPVGPGNPLRLLREALFYKYVKIER